MENLHCTADDLEVVFQDSWSEEMMPQAEDKLERTPTELKRLVNHVSSAKLVTLGITMAVPKILKNTFVGDDIIIIEGATARTEFVYRTL